jgi:hypothetical protein
MSRRTRTPSSAADVAPETAPDSKPEPKVIRLTDYLTVKRAENAADLRLKEAIHDAMRRICDLTSAFIAEKQAEGFSVEEILALYEVVGPVAPTVIEDDGRLKVIWDVQIVERDDGEAA